MGKDIIDEFNYHSEGIEFNIDTLTNLINTRGNIMTNYHKISFFVIQLVRNDSVSQSIDFMDICTEENQIIFLRPEQINKYNEIKGEADAIIFTQDFFIMNVSQKVFFSLSKIFCSINSVTRINVTNNIDEIRDLFLLMKNILYKDISQKKIILNNLLFSLLLIIEESYGGINNKLDISTESILVSNFKSLVNKELNKDLKMDYYTNKLNVSERTLQKAFSKVDQITPSQYIENRIILESKLLLIKKELSIGEIAYELGFRDHSHFSKFFKSKTGLSPRCYHKKVSK